MFNRLFSGSITPDMIHDHPPDMGVPTPGPIMGWDAHFPVYGTMEVIRVTDPVVIEKYGKFCITIELGTNRSTDFWYHDGSKNDIGMPQRQCWYQSCSIARFIRSREA